LPFFSKLQIGLPYGGESPASDEISLSNPITQKARQVAGTMENRISLDTLRYRTVKDDIVPDGKPAKLVRILHVYGPSLETGEQATTSLDYPAGNQRQPSPSRQDPLPMVTNPNAPDSAQIDAHYFRQRPTPAEFLFHAFNIQRSEFTPVAWASRRRYHHEALPHCCAVKSERPASQRNNSSRSCGGSFSTASLTCGDCTHGRNITGLETRNKRNRSS